MPIANDIRSASNLLTNENWGQGSYFFVKMVSIKTSEMLISRDPTDGNLCMCAHGALQAICNPITKELVSNFNQTRDAAGAWKVAETSARRSANAASRASQYRPVNTGEPIDVGNARRMLEEQTDGHSSYESSYLLGIVGLTASFNDHPDTTLDDVKKKFEEAAKLADTLGI